MSQIKYWNGYSWRMYDTDVTHWTITLCPGFAGIDRSVAPESLVGAALKYGGSVLTEELIQSSLDAMNRSGSRRPVVLVPASGIVDAPVIKIAVESVEIEADSDGCDHPGEPCIIGGPLANHGW